MADKLTQSVLEALALAAAEPGGLPLYRTKAGPGLFAATAAAKPAARRALDEGYLHPLGGAPSDRGGVLGQPCDLVAATEKGLRFLVEQSSPKQVLEDFVRGLERRAAEVRGLVAATERLARTLDGLKANVAAVLPQVTSQRVPVCVHGPARSSPAPEATMPAATAVESDATTDLAGALLARLSDWAASAAAGQDCPLPELYRSLSVRDAALSIGRFHDALRALDEAHAVYLHPWTGPLYALPEPAYALLAGHNVAYYASLRR